MVKIRVDKERCSGHARCFALAPEVYVLDESGYNSTDVDSVLPELEDQARLGGAACPELAITIIEQTDDDGSEERRPTS